MRYYWEQQSDDDPSGFLAMTSVLRLHDLMTASVDNCLRNEFRIGLTDYQILKCIASSARHATTVTLAVERLETKQLVKRVSHPHDRRATLVAITEDGRS